MEIISAKASLRGFTKSSISDRIVRHRPDGRAIGYNFPMPRDDGAWHPDLQVTTRHASDVHRQLGNAGVPGLTVLCHPNPQRVGETAALTGLMSDTDVLLSRLVPHFVSPTGGTPRPLADPHLSRDPICFKPAPDGGVRLDASSTSTTVIASGTPVNQPRDFHQAELDAGIVLLLGHRIALLLHSLFPPGRRPQDDFGLVGESHAMVLLRREIHRLADLDYPVLLRGESGTGKELVARALHESGTRRNRAFVAVNIGAIPPGLAATELFGTVKGAFTGADRSRLGQFQHANGGSLFLDEIGDTPANVQVLLLRVLESGRVQPVGASKPTAVDVRLISATDIDLEAAIGSGAFRSPLFHRLSSYEIELPPLRERRDDVGRLFFHFLRQELATVGEAGRLDQPGRDPWVSAELVARLACFSWPGNVRQLRNVVRQLVVASRRETEMRVPAKVERMLCKSTPPPGNQSATVEARKEKPAYRQPEEIGETELRQRLREHRWNVGATAGALNVARTSLDRLIQNSKLVRRASDLGREEIVDAIERTEGRFDAMVDILEVSRRGLKLRMTKLGLSASLDN